MRRISLSVLCEIGILTAMITILGSLKLPNIVPGRLWMIVLAGPIASTVSRLSLYLFLGNFTYVMMALTIPGMIFTAAAAPVFVNILRKIKLRR